MEIPTMSVARGYGINGKSYYTNICKPIDVNCNFIVDSANGNGLGVRSLKSNGFIESVVMHTSATPAANNPNPAVGYALVTFKNNFNYYLGGYSGSVAPLASTSTTSTTQHNPYVITSLGTTTLAQWQAAGLRLGLTPTVGQAFIATATGAIGGTGTVGVPGVPIALQMQIVGDPNQSLNNSMLASQAGAQVLIEMLAPSSSSTTTLAPTTLADGTIIALMFRFDGSSVTVDGL